MYMCCTLDNIQGTIRLRARFRQMIVQVISEFPGDQLWCRFACGLVGWKGLGNNTCEGPREAGWAEGESDCDAAEASANLWGALELGGSSEMSWREARDQTFARSRWCWMCATPGVGVELGRRAILGKGLRCERSAANTPGNWEMGATRHHPTASTKHSLPETFFLFFFNFHRFFSPMKYGWQRWV